MNIKNKVFLIILDGFGLGTNPRIDAIAQAKKPFITHLFNSYPWSTLNASSEEVGLPSGQMGNSEVGHMNIGAGRVVYQELTRINRSIQTGEFFRKPALVGAMENVKQQQSSLHLIGLLSDGGVHSLNTHLYALLELAKNQGVSKVFVHAMTDGRDTPPEAGLHYVQELISKMKETGLGRIATVGGRYYGMDRDSRWDRTEQAYRAIVEGKGQTSADPILTISEAYRNGITDEFIIPTVITSEGKPIGAVCDGDSVIFFNFRTDRPRQLTRALLEPSFGKFQRRLPKIYFATMTRYHEDFSCPVAFPPTFLNKTLGEIIAGLGLKQLHVAETEKYAHVTFFFNGGREEPFPGEDRVLVPSPRGVATYDQLPEMSAYGVTGKTLEGIATDEYAFIVMNYANTDMVGHSGNMEATIKAVEVVDDCLSKVIPMAMQNGFTVLVTADHGNADQMLSEDGGPYTAHSSNLVPFIVVDGKVGHMLRREGKLADIAPTILQLMGIPVPAEMDGVSMLAPSL